MYHTEIRNPRTGRINRVRAWQIAPRAVVDACKAGATARDISWSLLSDEQAYQEMKDTEYGDDGGSNFALGIFENALDFTLGMAVVWMIRLFISQRQKLPAPFSVVATRKGDVFCVGISGTVYDPFQRS